MARKPQGRTNANKPDIILGFPGPDFDVTNPLQSANIHDLEVHFIEFTSPSEDNMAQSIKMKHEKLEVQAIETKRGGWRITPYTHILAIGMRGGVPYSTKEILTDKLDIPIAHARKCWRKMHLIAIQRYADTLTCWKKLYEDLPWATRYPNGWKGDYYNRPNAYKQVQPPPPTGPQARHSQLTGPPARLPPPKPPD